MDLEVSEKANKWKNMKANEIIERITKGADKPEITCDTVKAGDTNKEIKRVALSMFATVEVVKKAKQWGADMLIVHEPTYYDHMDVMIDTSVTRAKKALIDESGIVIFRYHDCMHAREVDQITEGELHYLGLTGKLEKTQYSASYIFNSDKEIIPLEMAQRMERELGIKHVRIAGSRDHKARKIAACFGTPAGVFELLCDDTIDLVLTGEACEWKLSEYARDASFLGINKALIVMGHIPSERDGMRLLTERMKNDYPELEVCYIECGEVYSYTD